MSESFIRPSGSAPMPLAIPALAALIFVLSATSCWVMSMLPGLRRCI